MLKEICSIDAVVYIISSHLADLKTFALFLKNNIIGFRFCFGPFMSFPHHVLPTPCLFV